MIERLPEGFWRRWWPDISGIVQHNTTNRAIIPKIVRACRFWLQVALWPVAESDAFGYDADTVFISTHYIKEFDS